MKSRPIWQEKGGRDERASGGSSRAAPGLDAAGVRQGDRGRGGGRGGRVSGDAGRREPSRSPCRAIPAPSARCRRATSARRGTASGSLSLGGQATIEKPQHGGPSGRHRQPRHRPGRELRRHRRRPTAGRTCGARSYIGKVIARRAAARCSWPARPTDRTLRRVACGCWRRASSSCRPTISTSGSSTTSRRPTQLDQIFAKDGAIQALEKARAEEMVRFLGITGHADPFVLADGLKPLPVRHHPHGGQRRRQAPPQLHRAPPPAGAGAGDWGSSG
ncbi:MAG: hypothetical protein MZV49_00335 [Rhodopseudomonas palustris]|nr:hypothetical protein [Rhodopseudomonas palustris]